MEPHPDLRALCVRVAFIVALCASTAYADDILVSQNADRSAAVFLHGATIYRDVYVFFSPTAPEAQIANVEFFVDGTQVGKDNKAPYDMSGGSATTAQPYDTVKLLSDGPHTLEVVTSLKDGTTTSVQAMFVADNAYAPLASSTALQIVAANVVGTALILHGDNFDRGVLPRVAIDRIPVEVTLHNKYGLYTLLPSWVFDGNHTVTVSTDGVLAPGLADQDHAEIVVTVGAVGPPGPSGATGPIGPEGPQGAPGAPGISGRSVVEVTSPPVAAGGSMELWANCPAGTQVLGGGFNLGHADLRVVASRPLTPGPGWRVNVINPTSFGWVTYSAFAICAVVQ